MTPLERALEAGARALWEAWRTSGLANEVNRETSWDDLCRWAADPEAKRLPELVALCRAETSLAVAAAIGTLASDPPAEMVEAAHYVVAGAISDEWIGETLTASLSALADMLEARNG